MYEATETLYETDFYAWTQHQAALLRAALVDEVLLYVAPVLLGGDARPLFEGLHVQDMQQRLSLRTVETRRLGDDLRLLLRPEPDA